MKKAPRPRYKKYRLYLDTCAGQSSGELSRATPAALSPHGDVSETRACDSSLEESPWFWPNAFILHFELREAGRAGGQHYPCRRARRCWPHSTHRLVHSQVAKENRKHRHGAAAAHAADCAECHQQPVGAVGKPAATRETIVRPAAAGSTVVVGGERLAAVLQRAAAVPPTPPSPHLYSEK